MTSKKESYEQLLKQIQMTKRQVVIGGYYQHYKQKNYKVVAVAIREEDNALCVVYESENMPGVTWIRPLQSWLGEVEVDGKTVKRFTHIK